MENNIQTLASVNSFNLYQTSTFNMTQRGRVLAEYVWIDGTGINLRCKSKALDAPVQSLADLPIWNFDGSSTGQAVTRDSEVLLKPTSYYPDPFRGGDNIIVMCECLKPDGTPHESNNRHKYDEIMQKTKHFEPWFGLEQEYTIFSTGIHPWPLGWPNHGYPGPQGPYYCSVGSNNNFGRIVADAHAKACLYAGIKISGINAEVMPGQWEFQVGPCLGVDIGDQLWIARYLLHRVSELYNVSISFEPKPITEGDWNGSGCHTNYSTKAMREEGGYDVIISAIEKLAKRHMEHIKVYGEGNEKRLTGKHETAPIDKFSYGVADRGSSIRIPREALKYKKGYFEDRRPASNMDPYLVTSMIVETTCLL